MIRKRSEFRLVKMKNWDIVPEGFIYKKLIRPHSHKPDNQ